MYSPSESDSSTTVTRDVVITEVFVYILVINKNIYIEVTVTPLLSVSRYSEFEELLSILENQPLTKHKMKMALRMGITPNLSHTCTKIDLTCSLFTSSFSGTVYAARSGHNLYGVNAQVDYRGEEVTVCFYALPLLVYRLKISCVF